MRVFSAFVFPLHFDSMMEMHFVIVFKKEGKRWLLSDEAHTFMHLSYDIEMKDLHKGKRQKLNLWMRYRNFKLKIAMESYCCMFPMIDMVMRYFLLFTGAFSRFQTYRSYQEKELVQCSRRSFVHCWRNRHPKIELHSTGHARTVIRKGNYVIDCRINSTPRPLFVQALPNDGATRDATIYVAPV